MIKHAVPDAAAGLLEEAHPRTIEFTDVDRSQ